MNTNDIANLEKILPMTEKYGLAYIVVFVLLMILYDLLRSIIKGNLVSRELLDKVEEDKERLQSILDQERLESMLPAREILQRLDNDRPAGNKKQVKEK